MARFEMILKNSLGCEIDRFEIDHDGNEDEPLAFALRMGDGDLTSALRSMLPGDTLELIDNDDV